MAMYMGGPSGPTNPLRPGNEGTGGGATPALPANMVGPQAIRPSGPSSGYDASYLQNLAGFIGSLFAKPAGQTGNVTSFNPLGNLSEVSPPGEQIGNAPEAGAPLTWLQQALNGGGFSFGQSSTPTAPSGPVSRPIGVGGVGGINRGRNPILV